MVLEVERLLFYDDIGFMSGIEHLTRSAYVYFVHLPSRNSHFRNPGQAESPG